MNVLESFGEKLRMLRVEKGLTQRQLADALFITRKTISNWEAGIRMPDVVMLTRLSRTLGVKPYELMDVYSSEKDSPTLIIVEDEQDILTGFIHIVSDTLPEAQVYGFQTGKESLEFVEANRVDVAFLDVELFGESGIDLAGKLSAVNPTINVIFLTGHSEYTFDALQMHCSGYVLKPLTPEKVLKEMSHLRFPIQG